MTKEEREIDKLKMNHRKEIFLVHLGYNGKMARLNYLEKLQKGELCYYLYY